MVRIECSRIKEGVLFDAPVYFNDGENMFLAANRCAKKYHVEALIRWNIPFLWTNGRQLESKPAESRQDNEFQEIPVDSFEDIQF